jgi:alpha-tubulin suppressor-like RCC1 family protein
MSRRLHCFGQSSDGQLGVRLMAAPQSSAMIMRPVQVIGAPTGDQGCSVIELACGAQHTLLRTEDGQVWSCGGNDLGQLGRKSSSGSYSQLTSLIRCCYRSHCSDISDRLSRRAHHPGGVWDEAQLGSRRRRTTIRLGFQFARSAGHSSAEQGDFHEPAKVAQFIGLACCVNLVFRRVTLPEVIQVACGSLHSIALTESATFLFFNVF